MSQKAIRIQTLAYLCLLFCGIQVAQAQQQLLGQDTARRPILTAVPFLTISPDSRAGAMGDVGVATSPDANSAHWNIGKLAFMENDMGASISFSPWLQRLVNDMYLTYLTGYMQVQDDRYVAASLRYFDLGDMDFTNGVGSITQSFNPREFAFDLSYSMKLSERFAMGLTGRFIHSNLAGSFTANSDTRPANSAAVDLGAYYANDDITLGSMPSTLSFGAMISNVGIKMSYADDSQANFIPSNLRLGGALNMELNGFNKLMFALDINKLLVPSPPIYGDDNQTIISGKDPNRNLISGIFGSFGDAPDGFSEEMRELMFSFGTEYWYNDFFAARAGYFHEHVLKGARQYFTLGAGLKFSKFGFDISYLIARKQNHPLENTLRFSLMIDINKAED